MVWTWALKDEWNFIINQRRQGTHCRHRDQGHKVKIFSCLHPAWP